jgi:hypothetical protein
MQSSATEGIDLLEGFGQLVSQSGKPFGWSSNTSALSCCCRPPRASIEKAG